MIVTLYSQIGGKLSQQAWDHYFLAMPWPVQTKINRYRRWEDRQAGLFGKLLVVEGLVRYGYSPALLQNLVWDISGRPYIGGRIDFNISHSGEFVVCTLCSVGRIGIDIEKIRPIDLYDFKPQMTLDQWEEIMAAGNRLEKFFSLWTQKEALIKADGRGVAIPLDEITVKGQTSLLAGTVWRINQVTIADGYCCHLATNAIDRDVHIEKIDFRTFRV